MNEANSDISKNLEKVLLNIKNAEKKAGRAENSVKLLAVSKFHPVEAIKEAVKAGQLMFGENRVQEAYSKFSELYDTYPQAELHIIGKLQTNKVKKAVEIASCIESVDSLSLLKEIEKQCSKINKKIQVLFEYRTGEESKSGFILEKDIFEVLDYCKKGNTPHLIPSGFMTMAPFTDDESKIRSAFIKVRNIAEKASKEFYNFDMNILSMGMSGDFHIAIEEGATQVRIGTAIFGNRENLL